MPLNYQNQLQLLTDILQNHQEDCCGSVSECEQVERLVKSLMANTNIDENIKPILQEIYQYSHKGISSSNLDSHITSHQQHLSQWVDGVNTYS